MTSTEIGFIDELISRGLPKEAALAMMKDAMGYAPAATMFNNPGLDGQADQTDPHQLALAAAMQQQVAQEHQFNQMNHQMNHQMMASQQVAQAPIGTGASGAAV
jgi:hypothetical protein